MSMMLVNSLSDCSWLCNLSDLGDMIYLFSKKSWHACYEHKYTFVFWHWILFIALALCLFFVCFITPCLFILELVAIFIHFCYTVGIWSKFGSLVSKGSSKDPLRAHHLAAFSLDSHFSIWVNILNSKWVLNGQQYEGSSRYVFFFNLHMKVFFIVAWNEMSTPHKKRNCTSTCFYILPHHPL